MSATSTLGTPSYGINAIEYGDGSTIVTTTITATQAGPPGAYQRTFTHTYPDASDRTIRLWSARTGVCERVLFGHDAAVMALGFADATTLVSVGIDSIRRWALHDTPILRHHVPGEQGNPSPYVYGVAFSPDGTRLASCGWDGTARILDAATRRPLAVLSHPPRVYALAFDVDIASRQLRRY